MTTTPPPRRAGDGPSEDHTEDRTNDLRELAEAIASARNATEGLPWRERLLVTALSVLLTTGAGAGLFSAFEDWIKRPPAEVMLELHKLREDLDELREEVEGTADVARETFEIVEAAHPSRGRVGVPVPAQP